MISLKTRLMIMVLMISGFLSSLSQNLLTSALPSIMADFGVDAAVGQWLTTAYILVLGVITAISAYIFYRFPTKALVQFAVALFIAGCVISYFAPNFGILLISRIIQACGAGVLIPVLQVVVLYIYPQEKQGQAMALTGIIVGFAPAIGPILSGILVDCFGWRSIFLFLIGTAAFALISGHFVLRDIGERKHTPMDFLSALLYGIGFSAFMLAVTWMKNGVILQSKTLLLLAVGILCLWIFVHRQLQSPEPLLKMTLLKHHAVRVATLMISISYIIMMTGTILVPLYVQTICQKSATLSGMVMLPGSLLIALFSPFIGKLMDKYGARILCVLGMLCLIIGDGGFLLFSPQTSLTQITLVYGVRSLGLALLITPAPTYGILKLPLTDKAHGTAIINSLRQMSGTLFSTVLVIVATFASGSDTLNMTGIHVAFLIMTIIAALGFVVSLFGVEGK